MILESKNKDGIIHATILPKEASLANAEPFKEEMIQLVDQSPRLIVLSFEHVTYIDSSFLGSLVASLKYAIPRGIDIYLVALNKDVKNLLTLIRMDKVFKIFPDFQQAIQSLD